MNQLKNDAPNKGSTQRLLQRWVPKTLIIKSIAKGAIVFFGCTKIQNRLRPRLHKIESQSYYTKGQILRAKKVILGFTSNKKMLELGKNHPIVYKRVPVLSIVTS